MENQILEWVMLYVSGRLTSEEGRALRTWLDEAVENQKLFEQYLQIIKKHRIVLGSQNVDQTIAWKQLQSKLRKNNHRHLSPRWLAIVATLLLLFGVGIMLFFQRVSVDERVPLVQILPGTTKATLILSNGSQVDLKNEHLKEVEEHGCWVENDTLEGLQYQHTDGAVKQTLYHTIKVPVGGEYHFTLSDGTRVWMNSDSELKFPIHFSGGKREIFLDGEIYIEVAFDTTAPFVVKTAEVAAEVLGTKFNISAYRDEKHVVTTLLDGAVQVLYGEQKQLLHPGEQAIAHLEDSTLFAHVVDAPAFVSWIKGVFEYENMTLEQIATQLERWYDVKFIFSAPKFKERRFTGVVKKYDVLNEVLELIEKTTNVCFVIHEKTIAVQEVNR